MEILPNHDNVLIGFIAGASGVYMESLEEECLLDIFNEILTKCFPKLNLPYYHFYFFVPFFFPFAIFF
jgi:hypothetical protein